MKVLKQLFVTLVAVAFVLGIITPSINAAAVEEAKTESVTLHKLLMSESDLSGWNSPDKYDATQDFENFKKLEGVAGKDVKEIAGVYFAWQNENGEWVDKTGNEVASVDNALGGLTLANGFKFDTSTMKKGKYKIVEVPEKSTYTNDGATLTGSKAIPVEVTLPMYNNDGLVKDAHVYPKNSEGKPTIEKKFDESFSKKEKQDATIGAEVKYVVKTEIPANTKYKVAHWDDKMTEGLTFKKDSIVISVAGQALSPNVDYKTDTTDKGFTLYLTEQGLEKINGKSTKTTVELKYSAIINDKAISDIPESNDITFHYGNKPGHGNTPVPNKPKDGEMEVEKTFTGSETPSTLKVQLYNANTGKPVGAPVDLATTNWKYKWSNLDNDTEYKVVELASGYEVTYGTNGLGKITLNNKKSDNPPPLNPEEPKVVTGGKRFEKKDNKGTKLAGAEFVVKNSSDQYLVLKDTATSENEKRAYDEAEAAYQKAIADKKPDSEIQQLKAARDKAFEDINIQWTWGTEDKAFKFTSDKDGYFEVTGLSYGNYKLKETKAPDGYALLPGDVEFEVGEGTYYSDITKIVFDKAENQVIINNKVTIPQTGGLGSVAVIAAGIVFASLGIYFKRRNANS